MNCKTKTKTSFTSSLRNKSKFKMICANIWCLLFHRIWGGKLVFHYVWIQSCTAIQKRFQIEFCCYLSALKNPLSHLTNTYMGVCSFFIVKLISRNFTTGHCIYLDHNKSALSECGALHWVCVWRPSIATCEVKF